MNILFMAKGQYPCGAAYSTRIKALLSTFKDSGHNVRSVVYNINILSPKLKMAGII